MAAILSTVSRGPASSEIRKAAGVTINDSSQLPGSIHEQQIDLQIAPKVICNKVPEALNNLELDFNEDIAAVDLSIDDEPPKPQHLPDSILNAKRI